MSGMETRDDAGFIPFGGGLLVAAPEGGARNLVRMLRRDGVVEGADGADVGVTA